MRQDETTYPDGGPIVDVAWRRARLGTPGVRVVDTRSAPAYAAGHLPGAFHADLYQPHLKLRNSSPEERGRFHAALQAELQRIGIRPGDRVVFYEDVSGTVAARGVWLMDYAGHGGGALLDGGIVGWLAAGGEVTRRAPIPEPSDLRLEPVHDVLATAAEIRDAVEGDGHASLTTVDTRTDREYEAATIPTAIHLEWVRTLTADGRLRPPGDLRRLVADAGIGPDAGRIVTVCASGFRAAHTYVVLRALGYPNVANYAPSWNEWGNRPDLPIEIPE